MRGNPTYDFICFSDLAYEFSPNDSAQIEKKIKRRLKYYKLGPYLQERVDYIRGLKNDLHDEISKYDKSTYFRKATKKFADPADFDYELLLSNYLKKYPLVDERDMSVIINFAIYIYYLR